MIPVDIHTHQSVSLRGSAVVNTLPDLFVPEAAYWYSVGFHPWYLTAETSLMDWTFFAEVIRHPQVLAVGEAGLDKLAQCPLALQSEVFRQQAVYAELFHKPLVIHLVKAVDELLAVRRELRPSVPWIIHGFRGKAIVAEMWIRHGFYLSFGEHYQEAALRATPSNRLFLETDESFCPIENLYEQAAKVRGCATLELYETVERNVRDVFFSR